MIVQPGLCRTWSKTQIVGFLTHRLVYISVKCDATVCMLSDFPIMDDSVIFAIFANLMPCEFKVLANKICT